MTRRRQRPTPEQNAGRLIRKVAQVIEDRGWTRTIWADGKVCTRGGINLCTTGNAYQESKVGTQAEDELGRWLLRNQIIELDSRINVEEIERPRAYVPGWNDSHCKEEVLITLRKFADEMDPQR